MASHRRAKEADDRTRELAVDDQSWRVLCWSEADRLLLLARYGMR
jgi:hypothetical protein